MANEIPIPTLSIQGWVKDLSNKMDFALSHFFESDYNQTQLFKDNVYSITRLVQLYGSDPSALVNNTKQHLREYLSPFFDNLEISIETKTDQNIDPSIEYGLLISIAVIDTSATEPFKRLIKVKDSKISEIVNINNYGNT